MIYFMIIEVCRETAFCISRSDTALQSIDSSVGMLIMLLSRASIT